MRRRGPVVVLGDALLDVDLHGSVHRLCPDAPAPVVAADRRDRRPGGAALVAAMLAADGVPVRLVTALAGTSGELLAGLLGELGVDVTDLGRTAPSPTKQRVLVGEHHLLRIDDDDGAEAPRHPELVGAALAGASVVLASDYGKGLLDDAGVRAALARVSVPVVWDPHPSGLGPVPGCTLVTPNEGELAAGLAPHERSEAAPDDGLRSLVDGARRLVARWEAHALAVTRGARGALVVDAAGGATFVPTRGAAGVDACGAGDALAGAVAAALRRGLLPNAAVAEGVQAASDLVAGGGVAGWWRRVTAPQGEDASGLGAVAGSDRSDGGAPGGSGVVVATSGCFDLLHPGHVALLDHARSLGDRLVVLLNSDDSVARLKGPDRPIQSCDARAAVLRSLASVDDVIVFDDRTPVEALEQLRPDVYVKGGDYEVGSLPEADVVDRWGGVTVVVPYVSGSSTSGIIDTVAARARAG